MNAESDDDSIIPRKSHAPMRKTASVRQRGAELQASIAARGLGNRILEEIEGFIEIEEQFKRHVAPSEREVLIRRALGHAMGRLNARFCHDPNDEECQRKKDEWGDFESDAWIAEKNALAKKAEGP